jgi:hypothetical protein
MENDIQKLNAKYIENIKGYKDQFIHRVDDATKLHIGNINQLLAESEETYNEIFINLKK